MNYLTWLIINKSIIRIIHYTNHYSLKTLYVTSLILIKTLIQYISKLFSHCIWFEFQIFTLQFGKVTTSAKDAINETLDTVIVFNSFQSGIPASLRSICYYWAFTELLEHFRLLWLVDVGKCYRVVLVVL